MEETDSDSPPNIDRRLLGLRPSMIGWGPGPSLRFPLISQQPRTGRRQLEFCVRQHDCSNTTIGTPAWPGRYGVLAGMAACARSPGSGQPRACKQAVPEWPTSMPAESAIVYAQDFKLDSEWTGRPHERCATDPQAVRGRHTTLPSDSDSDWTHRSGPHC